MENKGYIFKKLQRAENEFDVSEVIFNINHDATMVQLIEEFTLFLKACGFSFGENETIGIINE